MKLFNNLNVNGKFTQNSLQSFLKELEDYLENKNSTYFSIDRIENDFAILENRNTCKTFNVPMSMLPKNFSKTSILKFENGKYVIDKNKTEFEKNNINHKVKKIYNKKL